MNADLLQPNEFRILIAEDDSVFAAALAAALSREGYAVDVAATGDEALDLAHAHRPDLVLLDLLLPGQSGFLVAAKLRLSHQVPKIICITALPRGNSDRWAIYAGVDAILHKPFNMAKLLRTIRRAIEPELAMAS
jgi:DNA-binding response OmpR family regulator